MWREERREKGAKRKDTKEQGIQKRRKLYCRREEKRKLETGQR